MRWPSRVRPLLAVASAVIAFRVTRSVHSAAALRADRRIGKRRQCSAVVFGWTLHPQSVWFSRPRRRCWRSSACDAGTRRVSRSLSVEPPSSSGVSSRSAPRSAALRLLHGRPAASRGACIRSAARRGLRRPLPCSPVAAIVSSSCARDGGGAGKRAEVPRGSRRSTGSACARRSRSGPR